MGKIYRVKDEEGNIKYPLTVSDAVIVDDKTLTEVIEDLESIAESAGVTGVKGSAEESYRTGNVEITAANLGLGNVTNESKATMFTSAALTGTPTAPTAAAGNNTTQIATTAFVKGAIDTLDVSDTEVDGQYVSKVVQTDGKIAVTRKALPTPANYAVTVTKKTTANTNAAATYTIAQAATNLSFDIDIPKDMVVSSGTVATYTSANAPSGVSAGTYLVLTLANATNDKVYINVGNLIEYVTSGSKTGDMIVVNVSTDHKVTATITDGTITKEKLASALQTSIDSADSAVQSISQGSANGTISVDGTDVAVKGLGSAAYKNVASSIAATDTGLVTAQQVANMGYTNNTGTITEVKAGNKMSGGGTSGSVTVNHATTTQAADKTGTAVTGNNNSTYTAITGIDVDSYGHVTGVTKTTLTTKNTTYSAATTSAAGLMSATDKTALDNLDAQYVIWEQVHTKEFDDTAVLNAVTAWLNKA